MQEEKRKCSSFGLFLTLGLRLPVRDMFPHPCWRSCLNTLVDTSISRHLLLIDLQYNTGALQSGAGDCLRVYSSARPLKIDCELRNLENGSCRSNGSLQTGNERESTTTCGWRWLYL